MESPEILPACQTAPTLLERVAYGLLLVLCLGAIILILLVPAESLAPDLVYRAF